MIFFLENYRMNLPFKHYVSDWHLWPHYNMVCHWTPLNIVNSAFWAKILNSRTIIPQRPALFGKFSEYPHPDPGQQQSEIPCQVSLTARGQNTVGQPESHRQPNRFHWDGIHFIPGPSLFEYDEQPCSSELLQWRVIWAVSRLQVG